LIFFFLGPPQGLDPHCLKQAKTSRFGPHVSSKQETATQGLGHTCIKQASKQARHAPPQGLDTHVASKQDTHLLEVWTICLKHKAHHLKVCTTCIKQASKCTSRFGHTCIKQATSAHQGLEFGPHVPSMKCTCGNQQKCVCVCVTVFSIFLCISLFFFAYFHRLVQKPHTQD
jgi:hypothetical protein